MLAYSALVALYIPTFYKLFSYGWKQSDYSHGPLILIVFAWLLWQQRVVFSLPENTGFQFLSLFILSFGLILYTGGVVSRVLMFETFSVIPVFLGCTGFLYGSSAITSLLFPALYLLFLVPPPLFFIDMITSPLKQLVAAVSQPLLSVMGYPVSRDGVLLFIGDYSLIIGDACSGLRSLVSLLAVGALYAWPKKFSPAKRAVLFLSIIPIAIAANIVRLVLLALITFYLGDSAGQKFFHDYSGFFLFIFSLLSLVLVDVLLDRKGAGDTQI
jgi:exosortase